MIKHLVSLILVFLLAPFALADYHYASHTGSNEYPYTSWATAADSIQKAIDAADRGDTIYVGEGTWPGNNVINDSLIALLGMSMANTKIQDTTSTLILIRGDTVLIEGFSFIGNHPPGGNSGISSLLLGYLTIKNNYFAKNAFGVSGNMTGKIFNNIFERNHEALSTVAIRNDLVFANNIIYHNEGWTFSIDDLHVDNSKLHIRNNILYEGHGHEFNIARPLDDSIYIHNNVFYKLRGVDGLGWVEFGISDHVTRFYNNTINGSSQDIGPLIDITGIRSLYSNPLALDNNIISNCEVAVWRDNSQSVGIRFSDLYNIDRYFDGPGELLEGNIFTDPMFSDTFWLRLQAFSPAIDAGDPTILDSDGTRSDIGAYGGPDGGLNMYLDLPPAAPDSFEVNISANRDSIIFNWHQNTEADFNIYRIYRDTLPNVFIHNYYQIGMTDTAYFVDTNFDLNHTYYYRITATDNQGNVSGSSTEIRVVFSDINSFDDPNLPRTEALYQNYPNPFNQTTTIRYSLPDVGYQPADVQIVIYDIMGRLVRGLLDEKKYPGDYMVSWDGRDDSGADLASGVYFCRMYISKMELSKPKKLMLLR